MFTFIEPRACPTLYKFFRRRNKLVANTMTHGGEKKEPPISTVVYSGNRARRRGAAAAATSAATADGLRGPASSRRRRRPASASAISLSWRRSGRGVRPSLSFLPSFRPLSHHERNERNEKRDLRRRHAQQSIGESLFFSVVSCFSLEPTKKEHTAPTRKRSLFFLLFTCVDPNFKRRRNNARKKAAKMNQSMAGRGHLFL